MMGKASTVKGVLEFLRSRLYQGEQFKAIYEIKEAIKQQGSRRAMDNFAVSFVD